MATAAHCVACFDALDAKLNRRKPLALDVIEASWAAYTSSNGTTTSGSSGSASALLKDPSLHHLGASSSSSSSTSSSAAASTPATSTTSLPLASVVAASMPVSAPLFVTWNTLEDDDGYDADDPALSAPDADASEDDVALRGCIGTFESQPLVDAIPEYALISALHDTRFPPIAAAELPSLQVAVTLLTDFEEVDDPYDWVVGVHGVRLSFHDRGRRYGSTYLPDVASEQGWTREQALHSLARKAGWVGSQSRFRELNLKVTRYQGKKTCLRYAQYKRWRNWRDAAAK
jgi:AMME syndrome candidate gene 1 protein